jgi:hypothetical protein
MKRRPISPDLPMLIALALLLSAERRRHRCRAWCATRPVCRRSAPRFSCCARPERVASVYTNSGPLQYLSRCFPAAMRSRRWACRFCLRCAKTSACARHRRQPDAEHALRSDAVASGRAARRQLAKGRLGLDAAFGRQPALLRWLEDGPAGGGLRRLGAAPKLKARLMATGQAGTFGESGERFSATVEDTPSNSRELLARVDFAPGHRCRHGIHARLPPGSGFCRLGAVGGRRSPFIPRSTRPPSAAGRRWLGTRSRRGGTGPG